MDDSLRFIVAERYRLQRKAVRYAVRGVFAGLFLGSGITMLVHWYLRH
jgi:formate/nitrite transporter FocA (FNT family)